MTDDNDTADRIIQDILTAAPFAPFATDPARSLEEAYALQDAVILRLGQTAERGPIGGWKIAANSKQLMERFKLPEPATGRVFARQRHDSPASLRTKDYAEFAFEPEIAAVMKETLAPDQAPFDAKTVAAAIDRFAPAMELLDMRQTDMSVTHIPDAIAQNISNVGAVLGGPGVPPEELDWPEVRTTLTIDGTLDHDVTGAAPQPPLEAVTWLANHLAARGLTLEAGQIVLCGTHSPIWYHAGTGTIEVRMSGLGSVAVTMT